MNFKDLCNTLAREVGIGGGTGLATVVNQTGELARVVGWTQQAYADVQGMYFDWKFLWTDYALDTEADQAVYASPDTWQFWDEDKARIDGVPGLTFTEYELWDGYDEGATGKPYLVIRYPDGTIHLYPAPDRVYTLSLPYYRSPHTLAADTDVPLIPAQFHDVIWKRALVKYGFYEAAPEVIQRVEAELPARISALETHQLPGRYRYGLAQDPQPLVVVPE